MVFQTALRSLSNRSKVVVGNYCISPITAEQYREKTRPLRPRRSCFAPAEARPEWRLRRALVEAPGTAPGSEWFIATAVYFHSRRTGNPNIGSNCRDAQGPFEPFSPRGGGGGSRLGFRQTRKQASRGPPALCPISNRSCPLQACRRPGVHACPYASAMAQLSPEANVWRVAEALAATFVRCDQAAVQAWLWISRLRHGGRDAARRGGLGFAGEA